MVSVKNTAVNLTAALLRIICLSLLSSLLYICGFQQFYYEVTGVVFFVFTGLVNLWVVSFNSFRKFSGIIFISVVSPQFSHKRPFHCYLTPALSANFCFFFLMSPGFLVGIFFWAVFWATKFLLQPCLVHRSFENLTPIVTFSSFRIFIWFLLSFQFSAKILNLAFISLNIVSTVILKPVMSGVPVNLSL